MKNSGFTTLVNKVKVYVNIKFQDGQNYKSDFKPKLLICKNNP